MSQAPQSRRPQRNAVQSPPVPVTKTKHVLCFLCLFDGLRTPSIRRLIRKPRDVCQNPLLTFDPSFFSPSAEKALQEFYAENASCDSTTIVVDPSSDEVISLIRMHGQSITRPVQRLIIHYFGQGCHTPRPDSVFFFSSDHVKYKPIRFAKFMEYCQCPLAFIFDCPCAAILTKQIRPDMFAFFACGADEELPLSTDAPLDLFSSCLLNPYDTAIWWHGKRHSAVYDMPVKPSKECDGFLRLFLSALLDTICFDSQQLDVYESYTLDPTVASLFRGFALAQRVMLSFNIHCSSVPALRPMAGHSLWSVWDTAVDLCSSLPKDNAETMLYQLCMDTFKNLPSAGMIPIYTNFMLTPAFADATAMQLLQLLDDNEGVPEIAARSNLPVVINTQDRPTETLLLIMAKMLATPNGVGVPLSMAFLMSKKIEVVRCGMLNMALAMMREFSPSFNKLSTVCINQAVDCAPISGIVLGLLLQHGVRIGLRGYTSEFVKMCENQHSDIRAAAVYLLGASLEQGVLDTIKKLVNDESPLVREQVLFAIFNFYKSRIPGVTAEDMAAFANDEDDEVRESYELVQEAMTNAQTTGQGNVPNLNPFCERLLLSVQAPGFRIRYRTNLFGY